MAALIRKSLEITSTGLNPDIIAPLLLAIHLAPDHARARILSLLHITPRTLSLLLRAAAALGLLRLANSLLSRAALNNWRLTGRPGWDWRSEVAVVTGGCSGIGKAVAEGLAARGVRVAVLDIQAAPREWASKDRIKCYQCDVTSKPSVAEAAAAIREDLGNPSVLVNNAGMGSANSILATTPEKLSTIFGVNLFAHWFTTQEFLPAMVAADKGHVVTVASMTSFITMPMIADYAASKAGAMAFHEGLTQELKHVYNASGVVTSIVHPHWVKTPLVSKHAEGIQKAHGRMLEVHEVAGPILEQILARRGGQLVLPRDMTNLAGARGWPTWVAMALRDVASKSLQKARPADAE